MSVRSSPAANEVLVRSRREFVRKGAAAAAGLPAVMALLSACDDAKVAPPPALAQTAAPPLSQRQKADAMDAMHEKGVKAFPAKTNGITFSCTGVAVS